MDCVHEIPFPTLPSKQCQGLPGCVTTEEVEPSCVRLSDSSQLSGLGVQSPLLPCWLGATCRFL